MERIIDKTIILIVCAANLFAAPFTTAIIVGLLLAIMASALYETIYLPKRIRLALPLAYVAAAMVFPAFVLLIPLVAYDIFRMKTIVLKLCWIVPLALAASSFSLMLILSVGVFALVASLLSWRTDSVEIERDDFTQLRDELREFSLALEQKNQLLKEKQDYEVKLATLNERGRIAREIHDNVGHLLTRSVLQVEALQVVHADNARLMRELGVIGTTVHEAFDTVRESVHDLHDDSFDLPTQLFKLAEENSSLTVDLDYQA